MTIFRAKIDSLCQKFRYIIPSNVENVKNIPKMSKMLKITVNFRHIPSIVKNHKIIPGFLTYTVNFGSKDGQNGSKNGRKSRILDRKFRPSTFDRRLLPFDRLSKMYRNIRLLTFPVYFPKITRISESLIETHGLNRYKLVFS